MPMSNVQTDECFLATTALEEFWDTSKPIVFLGEWCLLYERRSHWGNLDGNLMSSPYEEADAVEDAYVHINRIYEQILLQLGTTLNEIHGKDHGNRYWRIMIGPWLQLYLSAVYDRYVCVKHALGQYPGCTTIGLSEKSFVVPTDTLDFVCFLSGDAYNLQLFSKILGALGRSFPRKEIAIPRNPLYGKLHGDSWRRRAISFAVNAYAGISARFSKTVLLRNSYFPAQVVLKLTARNIGLILPSWNQMTPCPRFECDSEKRAALRSIEIGEGEFGRCLSAMLFEDIPQCFIEGLAAIEYNACKQYPKQVKAIFSANGWYYDELFKHWAATSAEKGTALLGTQHGGIYGGMKYMPSEDHETALVDLYYSWGWLRTDCKAVVLPMPATKLIGRNGIGADNAKEGILWVATTAPRYHFVEAPSLPVHFREYLEWQARFAKALPSELMGEVRFRPHYEDHGWGTVERIKDCFPDIGIETWDVPFQVSLENCRLYVCDHFSTTFAEALAANKPTILFCNPEANKIRSEAQPHFDLLKQSGILFDTPEAAAAAVAAVHADIEAWWNAPQRQAAIQSFCYRYARTSPDAFDLWSRELRRVSGLRCWQ
jgi:putative transferase (TIGR04331 family)